MTSGFFRAPARLLLFFIVLAGIPLAALGWLGWRLLEQDRALERQRIRDSLRNGAGLLATECDRVLTTWEEHLGGKGSVPARAVIITFNERGVLRQNGITLPYYPMVGSAAVIPAGFLGDAEAQEFRDRNLPNAAASYRKLASVHNPAERAAALIGLARCLRKQHLYQDALRTYGELAALGNTVASGAPAELVARNERIALWKLSADEPAARREADLLAAALQGGRFLIDRPSFDFYRKSSAAPLKVDREAISLAHAVDELWPIWHERRTGRTAIRIGDGAFVTVWRQVGAETSAITGRIDALLAPVWPLTHNLQVRLTLKDTTGQVLWGIPTNSGEQVTTSFRETGLPWTIQVASAGPASQQVWESRRNLFGAGFALMLVVITAAGYFVFRAVHRELEVARLQSDFVSAVSHEFRTPLTAMCHLAEMLEEGSAPPDRLQQYYGALTRETRRLHGMVESLLDFGRIEAGRQTYEMRETSAAELVREVVNEFRDRTAAGTERLALHAPQDGCVIRADQQAIALALRNLLDNAFKYSPESSAVDVLVEPAGDLTSISVADHGPGIAKEEQRSVFKKFVRGESARRLNVRGTGIGLAMADDIVRAHGGRLELASELGRGSRFTILLPSHPKQA